MKKKQNVVLLILLLTVRGLFSQTMSLEQCKQMALDNNSAIQIKQIHLKQAGHIKKTAFTQFLPSFGLSGSYIRMNKEFQLFENDLTIPVLSHEFYDPATGNINSNLLYDPALMPNAFVMNPSTGLPATDVNGNPVFLQYAWLPADQLTFGQKNNYLLNFGVIQPIYAGGKIRHLYKMSQALEQMAVHSLTAEQEKELMEIEELYWSLISVREQLKLAQTYKQLLEKLIADIESYQSEGIVLSNDLLKAQIKLNEAELNIMKAENGMKLIRKSLCHKIGLPLDRFLNLPIRPSPLIMFFTLLRKLQLQRCRNAQK
jgi:outer membrane protein TolC